MKTDSVQSTANFITSAVTSQTCSFLSFTIPRIKKFTTLRVIITQLFYSQTVAINLFSATRQTLIWCFYVFRRTFFSEIVTAPYLQREMRCKMLYFFFFDPSQIPPKIKSDTKIFHSAAFWDISNKNCSGSEFGACTMFPIEALRPWVRVDY